MTTPATTLTTRDDREDPRESRLTSNLVTDPADLGGDLGDDLGDDSLVVTTLVTIVATVTGGHGHACPEIAHSPSQPRGVARRHYHRHYPTRMFDKGRLAERSSASLAKTFRSIRAH